MGQAAPRRIKRCLTAVVVLLVHVALVWMVLQMRATLLTTGERDGPVVVVSLLEQRRPRNVTFGPIPLQVRTANVVHLQKLAPRVPDIPVDIAEPTPSTQTVPVQLSAPISQQADAGLAGDTLESSGFSGGGHALTLLKRVVPKYPAASAELREQGNTSVRLRVSESGEVTDVKVTRGSGSRRLDSAAMAAVRKWKFAPSPRGSAPDGTWVQTELRFVLYQFTYSRIGDTAADRVYGEQIKAGAKDDPTPGSQEAFIRFIADVKAGTFIGASDAALRDEVSKMRGALEEWGDVQSIQFIGTAGERRWMAYQTSAPDRHDSHSTVEVSWNMFEVHHQHATSAWLIAVGRDGTIWNARASPAPWL